MAGGVPSGAAALRLCLSQNARRRWGLSGLAWLLVWSLYLEDTQRRERNSKPDSRRENLRDQASGVEKCESSFLCGGSAPMKMHDRLGSNPQLSRVSPCGLGMRPAQFGKTFIWKSIHLEKQFIWKSIHLEKHSSGKAFTKFHLEKQAQAAHGGFEECKDMFAHDIKLITLLDLCVSSLRRVHVNLLCIAPTLTDDPRREPMQGHFWGAGRSGGSGDFWGSGEALYHSIVYYSMVDYIRS